MPVPFDIRETDEFKISWATRSLDLEIDPEAFDDKVGAAIDRLTAEGIDNIKPHGKTGRKFSIPIDADYLLIFRWDTDRSGEGTPLFDHLVLLAIEHVQPRKKIKQKSRRH